MLARILNVTETVHNQGITFGGRRIFKLNRCAVDIILCEDYGFVIISFKKFEFNRSVNAGADGDILFILSLSQVFVEFQSTFKLDSIGCRVVDEGVGCCYGTVGIYCEETFVLRAGESPNLICGIEISSRNVFFAVKIFGNFQRVARHGAGKFQYRVTVLTVSKRSFGDRDDFVACFARNFDSTVGNFVRERNGTAGEFDFLLCAVVSEDVCVFGQFITGSGCACSLVSGTGEGGILFVENWCKIVAECQFVACSLGGFGEFDCRARAQCRGVGDSIFTNLERSACATRFGFKGECVEEFIGSGSKFDSVERERD